MLDIKNFEFVRNKLLIDFEKKKNIIGPKG